MDPEQQQAIAELRALKLAPKQIARKLGLKPAEVQAVIKQQAEQAALSRVVLQKTGEVDKLGSSCPYLTALHVQVQPLQMASLVRFVEREAK